MAEQQHHPITPSPELVQQWLDEYFGGAIDVKPSDLEKYLATQAARWGADQKLEACREWLREARNHGHGYGEGRRLADKLSAARRPKPPSLAEQALKTLYSMQIDPVVINGINVNADVMAKYATIRAALERLQELEGKQ